MNLFGGRGGRGGREGREGGEGWGREGGEGGEGGRDYCYRPLSRRLDRCDRMIQNEGNDSRKLFTLKIALCR